MADLDDIERMVNDWERNATEKSQRFQRMQEQVQQISITESVASGAVSVTVGQNGLPTNVAMTDAVRQMSPDQIAANVLRAMRKAQSKYPERLQEITAETVGDDETTRHLVSTAAEQFPEPPEEQQPEREAPGKQLRVETEVEEEPPPPSRPAPPPPPPPKPQARRRPPADEDEDDFGDQSFMRRD